jgi:hypothetical protein
VFRRVYVILKNSQPRTERPWKLKDLGEFQIRVNAGHAVGSIGKLEQLEAGNVASVEQAAGSLSDRMEQPDR